MLRTLKRFLSPGVGVKRWLAWTLVGVFSAGLGLSLLRHGEGLDILAPFTRLFTALNQLWPSATDNPWLPPTLGTILFIAGAVLALSSFSHLVHALAFGYRPVRSPGVTRTNTRGRGSVNTWVNKVVRSRYLAQGPRVVAIGGGTGLSTMLRGVKNHTSNIVAVVTVTDDGGSSGRLQKQLNIPPPGDIRNCLVALADEEGMMTQLLQHRFRGSGPSDGLRDHAVGNLLIAALTEITGGDFQQAVRQASRVLNVRGEVWPATLTRVSLRAEMEDGSVLDGETTIAHSPLRIKRVMLNPPDVEAPAEVLDAIENADIIVIGPGSVFTSVVPNLLVRGIPEALAQSRAPKVYVCNVMTQPGETDGFAASDHVKAVAGHVPVPILDYVIVNTATPSRPLLDKYEQTGSILVHADVDRIRQLGYRTITGDFISQTDVVRHDSAKLAEAVMRLVQ